MRYSAPAYPCLCRRVSGALLHLSALLLFSGCASTPPKSAPQADAWIVNTNWQQITAVSDVTLKGKNGFSYPLPGAHLSNLRTVVTALQAQSRLDPQVALVASDAPNAFATMNNGRQTIALTLPMLKKIGDDQDALATTLGHELAHLYLKHGELRRQRAESAKGVSDVLGVVLGVAGIPLGGTLANLGVGAVTSAYSRDEERDADVLGLRWAMAAGYSACGSARTMQMLKTVASSTALPFLASHPGHDERIARANQTALKAGGPGC